MKEIVIFITYLMVSTPLFSQELSREYINPASGYSNAVAVTNGDVVTLYLAGQVGSGDTLEEQIRSSFKGVLKQLDDGGATLKTW